ncbi:reverse transcriptase domain-containing protein, partial [Tanacetum coccineum]
EGNHTPATEQERKYKEEIMDATTPFHMFRITHHLKILNSKEVTLTGLATIKLEFLNQEVLVGIKTRSSVEEISSNASAKLMRAELNKRSRDADLSKDKSGPESPPEFRRSWYVEGHIRSGVISSVLGQRHLRNSPTKGDEGPSSGGTKPSSTFITAEMKATPRKLAYADSNKEAPVLSLAKGFSDRFSLESSGTSNTYRQTRSTSRSQKTLSRNKEPAHLRRSRRLEDRSITKEKVRKERSKSRRKRSEHQEASSNSEYEEGLEDAYEDLNSSYKWPKLAPFTQRITRFKYHRRAKLPWNIRVYEGNKDLEDHLGGAARNWFDDLDPKSVDSFEELSQKFLEEFSQQKKYAKDPTEIHGIKRRKNEGLQAFMDQFMSESSHIKGVPPVLRISAFMHGHGHPELAKKLNYKIPKTMDEMFERV